jgi:hypothetical protein
MKDGVPLESEVFGPKTSRITFHNVTKDMY